MRDIALEDIRSDIGSDAPIMEAGDCLHKHEHDDKDEHGPSASPIKKKGKPRGHRHKNKNQLNNIMNNIG